MFHSLLKPLVLFIAFAGYAGALAAPAHQHQIKPHARDMECRDDQLLSHSGVAEPITIVRGQRGRGENSAIEKRLTNAMRFADGLPPLAPRKLYNGSRAGSAHIARSSPMPVSGSGILVYDQDGYSGSQFLGRVSQGFNDRGAYYFTPDCTEGMGSEDLFLGALINRGEPNGYSNVGFTVNDPSNAILSTDSSNFAYMSGLTVTTPTGSVPVLSTGQSVAPDQNLYIGSNEWSLGAEKNDRFVLNEIFPAWVNPDGKVVPLELGYVPDWANSIIASPNLSQLGANSDGEFEVVRIRFYLAGGGCQR